MKHAILVTGAILIVVLSGCSREVEPTPEETVLLRVGDSAPGFELTTIGGETFNLEAQRGKVVLINFFATWCPPCRDELPHLEEQVWKRFDHERFSLIVIGREEDDEIIVPFVEKHDYTVPFAGDPEMVAYSQYATRYIPRNFVVGPDGTILYQSQGFARHEFDEMIGIIERAIAAIDPPETADAPASHPED